MKKTKVLILSLLLLLIPVITESQTNEADENINWLTFDEAVKKSENNPQKIFMYIYTDWCSYCKRMESQTFSNPAIIDILNDEFLPVKLNAEQTEPITYRGQVYENENPGGRGSAHSFAIAVLQGKMGYPSHVFFDEELNLITALPGYYTPEAFEPRLVFFLKDIFIENPDLNKFIESYDGSY